MDMIFLIIVLAMINLNFAEKLFFNDGTLNDGSWDSKVVEHKGEILYYVF